MAPDSSPLESDDIPPSRPHPKSKQPVLAIDLDDVLMATNETIAQWHNANFGTDMTLSHFYYYHYWKNPYWGTPHETLTKVHAFYQSDAFRNAPPADGAITGVAELLKMGLRLVIVTARGSDQRQATEEWVSKHLPGCIEAIYFTGEYVRERFSTDATPIVGKPAIIRDIGAFAMIDDSLDNAISCATELQPHLPVILFGSYQWNRRYSPLPRSLEGQPTYVERSKTGYEWWKRDVVDDDALPPTVRRVADWKQVVPMIRVLLSEVSSHVNDVEPI